MLAIPTFPEANHETIRALAVYSDRELVSLHRLHPEQGKFFAAFFCRYATIVYSVVRHAAASEKQANYLFAIAWQQIFQQLQFVKLSTDSDNSNLQNWTIDIAGKAMVRIEVPSTERVRYDLAAAPPPLHCYLDRSLNLLSPLVRAIVVMHECFKWNEQRICAYLQGEGEKIAVEKIADYLQEGYQKLEANLPHDIQEIYHNLGGEAAQNENRQAIAI